MFGISLGKDQKADGVLVVARLNARAQPLDRYEVYEEGLTEMLESRGLGEVSGGGTQMTDSGEVAFCDIEIVLPDLSDTALDELRQCLEALGAPKGSAFILEPDDREIAFGLNEGLAVYLNGTDLPDEVYETCDLDTVYEEFGKLLGAQGRVQSHWQGPIETALYLYGPSCAAMRAAIQPFLASYPLCQKARLEQIA
ncbi:MAG: hypothetical protein QNJ06_17875 [Kiloniellales bacterium]|nr:hypothetical protein [Kiloniellales bacterium]MDJ0971769.1 hypothetical protein [Kiloniellales bacterium]